MKLYEILVPAAFPFEIHEYWDQEVSKMVGGLTILPKLKGKWENTKETMIPIRVACEPHKMEEVAFFTKGYYQQQSVLYYVISEEAYLV